VFLRIFHILQCVIPIFQNFQFSCHTPGPIVCISHFLHFSVLLAILQVKQFLRLIFYLFKVSYNSSSYSVFFSFCVFYRVSRHNPGPTVSISHFSTVSLSGHIPGPTVIVSHFACFQGFSPYSRSYSVCFSFSTFFRFFFGFVFCFLPYSRSNSVCVSFSMIFSFLAVFQVLQCVFLIQHVFQCFLPYSRSYSVYFSFCTFSVFLAIMQVLPCEFLIFLVCQLSCHIPCPTVCVSHSPRLSVFLAMF
jgi:hypothetical protein